MADRGLSIQEVATRTGLSAHTLRYYERIGLLDPIERAANGYRRYAATDLAWIDFLTRLRATGMPIRQMQRFAELRREGAATVPERRALLEAHGRAVRLRLEELERNLFAIEEKADFYANLEARDGDDDRGI